MKNIELDFPSIDQSNQIDQSDDTVYSKSLNMSFEHSEIIGDRVKYNDNIEDIDVNDDGDHTPLLPPPHHYDVNVVGTLSSLRKTRKS